MDQLISASLSHTHYWYEVGMLKVPVSNQPRRKLIVRGQDDVFGYVLQFLLSGVLPVFQNLNYKVQKTLVGNERGDTAGPVSRDHILKARTGIRFMPMGMLGT